MMSDDELDELALRSALTQLRAQNRERERRLNASRFIVRWAMAEGIPPRAFAALTPSES